MLVANSAKFRTIILIARRFLAILSLGAFIISVAVYAGSFNGLTMGRMGRYVFELHGGMILLLLLMCATEHSALRERTFFWKGFSEGMPAWVYPTLKLLGLSAMIHFVLFLALSHAAAPDIMNGKYVLNDHGQIKKVLTEAQYLSLKGYELRIFASAWIFVYFILGVYWWFPRGKGSTSDINRTKGYFHA